MSSALFSPSWYRVAELKPRLRTQARVFRHYYRGERWYVVQDLGSGRFLRLNAMTYRLVALMDGVRTLEEIWKQTCASEGDAAPTQEEILQVLAQLHQANVLLTDRKPDLAELDQRRIRMGRMKLKQYLANPLALRFPLFDPDRLLGALVGWIPTAAGPWLLLLWLLLVASGVFLAVVQWEPLTRDLAALAFSPEYVLLVWLAFPLLKVIHELGHGLAIKFFGGQCHEIGVMLLVLMPVPYVDASQSLALSNKYHRMLVGLAGMMIELAVAAVALWLWAAVSPGLLKAFLHEVVLLAGITTLLFNANPLLRLDGYYVLADWLEIPNLGQKANQYVGYLVTRYLFGVRKRLHPPHMTPGEPAWLVAYSLLSFAYRMVVATVIILFVGGQMFFVGILLACWAAYSMLLLPLLKQVRFLVSDGRLAEKRRRAWTVSGVLLGGTLLFLLLVPVPSWTAVEGVIWMPEQSQLRTRVPCFGAEVLVAPGTQVARGDALLRCAEPELDARVEEWQARLQELQARRSLAYTQDRVAAQIVQAELQHAQQMLALLSARQRDKLLLSPHAGEFAMAAPDDFVGRYVERGDVVGYVLDPERSTLLAVVPQGAVDLVRHDTREVQLRTVENVWELLPARILREVPAATAELPSLALSLQGGGDIGLDPSASQDAPRALESLYQFELEFTGEQLPRTLGNRVFVHFVHSPEPLAEQWYRVLRRVLIKHFEA